MVIENLLKKLVFFVGLPVQVTSAAVFYNNADSFFFFVLLLSSSAIVLVYALWILRPRFVGASEEGPGSRLSSGRRG